MSDRRRNGREGGEGGRGAAAAATRLDMTRHDTDTAAWWGVEGMMMLHADERQQKQVCDPPPPNGSASTVKLEDTAADAATAGNRLGWGGRGRKIHRIRCPDAFSVFWVWWRGCCGLLTLPGTGRISATLQP